MRSFRNIKAVFSARWTAMVTAAALMLAVAAVSQAAGAKAYVGLFGDNAVAVIDTATNTLLTTIPIPAGPHGLVITPDGATVYASSDGDS